MYDVSFFYISRLFFHFRFYKTLNLWLEEPRLQESGLYIPALPPQYMTQKLIVLMQGDQVILIKRFISIEKTFFINYILTMLTLLQNPWFEYVDFWSAQQSQLEAVQEWEQICFRDPDNQYQKSTFVPPILLEIADPLERIFKRLDTYEHPVSPPLLSSNNNLFTSVSRENLYAPETVVTLIKPHLKIILDYAQTYNLLVSEHTAIDCNFLELIPTLYREIENYITLHALCDPAPVHQKRVRSGVPPIVHCAGAAVIRIKVKIVKYYTR